MDTPFDASRASMPTRVVGFDQIVDLLHVSHAHERIAAYRQAMLDGCTFPPISVFRVGRHFVITDGHKRFAAASGLGLSELDVEVWSIRELAADLFAQLVRHIRAGWRAATGVFRGREARREGAVYAASTLHHWRRMAASLWTLVVGPRKRPDREDAGESSLPR